MSATAHERALDKNFHRLTEENSEWASMAAETRSRLKAGGFYAQDIVDASFQKWSGDKDITLVEAFGFLLVWTHYLKGEIACCHVPMPRGPARDHEVALNQSLLDQLPDGFRATFSPEKGASARDDGSFTIEKDIGLRRVIFDPETGSERSESWFLDSDRELALEVGTTRVSRTLLHLRSGNGVARWPYEYDRIVVMVATTPLRPKNFWGDANALTPQT
jgi:hypothetical protein